MMSRVESATSPRTLESFSPVTGERVGAVPVTEPEGVQAAVGDIARVQPFWSQLPLSERARYMRRTAQVIIDHLDELATLIAREQGKPRTEAYLMELVPAIDSLHWIADHGPRLLGGERIRYPQPFFLGKRSWLEYDPLGVVGVIAPWNYPWAIPFGQMAVALMCGNGVVLKPSSLTPLTGQRIQAVFERAGLPDGIVRAVQGGAEVGNAVVEADTAKVFFTGSEDVGRRVAAACSERLKGCVLELGGKDPMLVLADANLEHAVAGCVWAAFANAGQSASGIERVYVLRDVADEFLTGVVEAASALRVGDPLRDDVDVGPLASGERFEHVRELVDEAVAGGATLHCGGPADVEGLTGRFFAPAVLTGVRPEMRIMREEALGPVVAVVEVRDEEEAIALANASEFGLGASVWTADRARGRAIARRLEAGTVWINDHLYSHGAMQAPWGGVKRSGLGRTHSKFGFYECVNLKHVAWEPSLLRSFWWFPYQESLATAVHAAAQLLYGRDADKRGALARGAVPFVEIARRTLGR